MDPDGSHWGTPSALVLPPSESPSRPSRFTANAVTLEADVNPPGTSTAAAEEAPSQTKDSQKAKQGPKVTLPEGRPEPPASQAQREEATVANILLGSPSIKPSSEGTNALPATYTCDGKNTWPALAWKGIPQGTEELILLVLNLAPVKGENFFYWAVAGLDPSLEGIEEGKLPPGAILGENSFGENEYDLCPDGAGKETFLFTLYAIPKALSPEEGFDPLELRESTLSESGNAGLWAVSYQRGG